MRKRLLQEALSTRQIERCVDRVEAAIKLAEPNVTTLFVKPQDAQTWRNRARRLSVSPDEPSETNP